MDAKNTPIQHAIVGISSLALAFIFNEYLSIGWSTSFARVSFFLLFIVLIIGPIMKLRHPKKVTSPLKVPITWRGEIGIWFALTGLIHFYFVISGRANWSLLAVLGGGIGGGGYGLANLLGMIALIFALILAATSFGKVIIYLGSESWTWLHKLSYVIFYLVAGHMIYFQYFSTYKTPGPDWFGYTSVLMVLVVLILQIGAFVKSVKTYKKIRSKRR